MFTKRSAHPVSSLKTALFFITFVVIILVAAISVKVVQTMQKSTFDGQHQFVLLLQSPQNKATLASFDPAHSQVNLLYITNPKHDVIQEDLPLGIDAIIQTDHSISTLQEMQHALLANASFFSSQNKSITWYDLLRLYFISKTSQAATISENHITLPANATDSAAAVKPFLDPELAIESLPIQIINASDVTGQASNLETLLTNTGFSVIDVRTSSSIAAKSVIRYYGTMSYTLQKLHRMLGYPLSQTKQQMIGSIQIVIGKDGNQVAKF